MVAKRLAIAPVASNRSVSGSPGNTHHANGHQANGAAAGGAAHGVAAVSDALVATVVPGTVPGVSARNTAHVYTTAPTQTAIPVRTAVPVPAQAPSENRANTAESGPLVGTAMLVAEPVYDDPQDGVFVNVVDELRNNLRNMAMASGLSALVHCIILTLLGLFAVSDVIPLPPYLASRVPLKEPITLEASVSSSPAAEIPPPVVARVEMTPKTAGVASGNKARGNGSAGANRGAGGGTTGGMAVPGLSIGPVQKIASGGNHGLGADGAFGKDMMGDAGEPIPSGATFFGVKAEGKSFAFVVDTSGSMGSNMRYMRCRDELLRSVGGLHYRQKYFIVFFNHTIFPMPERQLVEARPNQVRQTTAWITGAMPVGFTEPWPGLLMAIRMKPDAIYLLTDGEFDTSVLEKVVAAQPNSKKIPIHTIAFESQAGEQTLQTISRVTGGTYRYVP
jgi:hypothetical protein